MALLLEREAAELLRISKRTVKALRLSGRLAYLPGRPVRIDERDLDAYVDQLRREADRKQPEKPRSSQASAAAAEAAARARGMKRLLAKRLTGGR